MNNHRKNSVIPQILVVDDTPVSLKLLTEILTNQGFQVRPALSGKLALRSVEVEAPDIILLDVKMPEMDGYDVCRRLKSDEKSRRIPVIFISALDETLDKVKGFEVGGVDYITKPFEPAEVLARVNIHLGLRQLQEHMEELVRQRTVELSHTNISLKKEIEERTRAEEALSKVNRMLKMLSECNQAVVRAQDENALLHDICRHIVEIGSYTMAWVGFTEQDEGKTILPAACAGCEEDILKKFKITWSDTDDGYNPTGTAIRTGKPAVCENMKTGHSFNPGFAEAVNRNYRSSIAVPLIAKGNVFGALTVYGDKPGIFDSDELDLLTELASDVAYGIEALRTQNERKKAEEALRESEEKYRLTFSSISDVVYTIDPDLKITSITPNVEQIMGYKADELINRTFQDFPFLTPESMEKAASDIMRVFSGEQIPASVYEFIAKDGTRIFAEISGSPLMREGKIIGLTSVARDITERKQVEDALRESEQRYRILTDNATDIIWSLDRNLRFTFASPSIEKVLGWTVEEAKSLNVQDVVTPNSLNMVMKVFEEELANEQLSNKDPKRTRTLEIEHYRKDGTTILIEVTASFLRNKEGNVFGIMGISREISERKKLEAQIRQAQKMEAIGTLAGGIAHDFNNILGAIMGYTDLALSNIQTDGQIRRYLERVYQAGERARDLVKQILTFSRQTEQERTSVHIAGIVKEVLKLLRSSLPTTIEIQQDIITPPGRDVVLADPTQIHQVLMNICTNAAHAMRAKGGILGVSIWDIDADAAFVQQYPDMEPGPYIKLTVSDTGHGMDAAVKERIFEPYFTTKGVGEGTGLGLAVVQGIVKSYGGAITVSSEPGRGSIFHVYIPRYEEDIQSRVEEVEVPPFGNERILFVDDEKMLVEMGRYMLESLGYRVTAATSSIEALEIFRNDPESFDLVFTDMTMPKMTGTDLARECMIIRPDIPVVLGTGFSEMTDEAQAKELGVRAFVMKPYVKSSIAKMIRTALEKQ